MLPAVAVDETSAGNSKKVNTQRTISVVSSRAASYVQFEETAVAYKSMTCGRGGNQA